MKNLYLIETVDSEKLASALENAWPNFRNSNDSKLKIMVQVNTSKENGNTFFFKWISWIEDIFILVLMKNSVTEKNGCEVEEASSLVKHVLENCKNLEFMGLMTIGQYGYDVLKGPNPDFRSLIECRKNVCHELGLDMKNVQLSMGMSSDFEHAVSIIY